ncbi:YhgE/Pip domain-containing protein [uncultured Methanobrevibacter sp.]|uniref:YhgE/Pip domain-containing protein n=1 Tax=uncultured Methanobrevibacter sp. TaxID=253161 RepID=UPI0025DB4921|nr:YhgE/Pip domain-containing protein [uncultured Methanobrevibacter sp.]
MSGRDIRNIFEIMKTDFKNISKSPIAMIVIIAIIILPSLYALLNIQACWDPYENTGDIDFAIANLDNGSSYEGQRLNVGNELVKELKDNDDFNWVFVTEKELRDGVDSGKYYAGIIIPKNMSENVISITSDNPHSAELQYVVNIKANPVANKLTDSGSKAVYNTMNAKIVEFINLAAYGKLGELQSGLAAGAGAMSSGAGQLQSGAGQVSAGASELSSGAASISNGANKLNDGASQVSQGAQAIDSGASQVSSSASEIKTGSSQVQKSAAQLDSAVDTSQLPDGPVKQVVEGSKGLANASSKLAGGSSALADGSVELAKKSSELANGASGVAGGASELASGTDELAKGALSLAAGSELLSNSAAQALITAASSLSGAAGTLSEVTGVNESMVGDYFFSPVKLNREEVYPVENYGSNVAPFYIVLSMWVGAVITCVMIRPGNSSGTKYSPLEMYFGKQSLFVIMSILQCIVTLTGIYLLGIKVDNPALFVFSCVLVSTAFMLLIYSLVSSLGQIGKGIGVILLVLQISGTGGIYPIEIMDPFFKVLYPYLPMTYAINIIRESLLGVVWANYLPALIILAAMIIATIIVSVIIKEKADDKSHYIEERLEKTGIF